MRNVFSLAVGGVAFFALTARPAAAQDAKPAPCHDRPCILLFDWGPGMTAASFPADRKYGSGDDFEAKFRTALSVRGYRLADNVDNTLTMTVRPRMVKAMCDALPGTNTDYSCQAMSDVAIQFASSDPAVKAPSAVRVANRCGASSTYISNPVFALYVVEMVYYNLEGEAKKDSRPKSPGC